MKNNQSIFEQPTRELAKLGSRELKNLSNTICRGGKYNATKMMLISIARGTTTGNYFDSFILNNSTHSTYAPDKIAKLNKRLKRQSLQIERLSPVKGWSARQHAWVLVKAGEVSSC